VEHLAERDRRIQAEIHIVNSTDSYVLKPTIYLRDSPSHYGS
jgi:hypothetical protein